MWNLFREKYPDEKCGLHFYQDIYNTGFKLRFGLPRSDTCEYCDRLFIKMKSTENQTELRKLEVESQLHHTRPDSDYKSLGHNTKISSENNKDTIVICVDLEQVLYLSLIHI